MIALYIDSNIYLNLFFKEEDPKTGKKLWSGSKQIFDLLLAGKIEAYSSITALMEIVHAFRVRGVQPGSIIEDCLSLGVQIIPPDSLTMMRALQYQVDYSLDPYDAVALSVAVECKCDYLVTRDRTFMKHIGSMIPVNDPESILDMLI